MKNYSSMKLELLALKWAVTEKFREYLLESEFMVYTDNKPWAAELASCNFKIEYRASKHNTNADALSRIRWQKTLEYSTEEKEDARMDVTANTTLTAEMLAIVADTTRVPERVQLGMLRDAICMEELGVTRPADKCAEPATSLPSIPRD